MRVWTQTEIDGWLKATGGVALGTGDFRNVDFRGKHNLSIGPGSILGHGVRLGVGCEIGERCEIGDDFSAEYNLSIGSNCHFGRGAKIGEYCRIGRNAAFADGAQIGRGAEIEHGVSLGRLDSLMGVKHADGRTLCKMTPVDGGTVYAFAAGRAGEIHVNFRDQNWTLEEFERRAVDGACCCGMSGSQSDIEGWRQVLAAAHYIRTRFALLGLCHERRAG